MITVQALIDGSAGSGLWHGTRSGFVDKLVVGTEVIGSASDVVRLIWNEVSKRNEVPLGEVLAEDVGKFFTLPDSQEQILHLGNSIRYLRGHFEYSVIAFGFDKYTALGYAKEGSELANAVRALCISAMLEYPDVFNDSQAREKIRLALVSANNLISDKGMVLRLTKMPKNGYFCVPGNPGKEVEFLSRKPFEDRLIYGELFFKGSIPLDHFDIEEV